MVSQSAPDCLRSGMKAHHVAKPLVDDGGRLVDHLVSLHYFERTSVETTRFFCSHLWLGEVGDAVVEADSASFDCQIVDLSHLVQTLELLLLLQSLLRQMRESAILLTHFCFKYNYIKRRMFLGAKVRTVELQ